MHDLCFHLRIELKLLVDSNTMKMCCVYSYFCSCIYACRSTELYWVDEQNCSMHIWPYVARRV
jgi:hypothetical protein